MKEILTLVQLQHDGEAVIASIGGFDLKFSGERLRKDGFHYATMLLRNGVEHEVELPVTTTPIGAIARLEHALADFEGDVPVEGQWCRVCLRRRTGRQAAAAWQDRGGPVGGCGNIC
jgi:hypothetical protein